jgi:hypothetical protein
LSFVTLIYRNLYIVFTCQPHDNIQVDIVEEKKNNKEKGKKKEKKRKKDGNCYHSHDYSQGTVLHDDDDDSFNVALTNH